MTELLTAAQMRAIEQAAIEAGEVTGLELMERAGRGVVEAILEWRPELATAPHRAVVLCGPGNNGGDGFVVARLLHDRGWDVDVFLYGDETKLPPDAAENARRWRERGEVAPVTEFDAATGPHDLRVDALFGTGLTRPLQGDLIEIVERAERGGDGSWQAGHTVAVDIQSGRCADSGQELGDEDRSIFSELVVTFHRPKIGHFVRQTSRSASVLRTVDIGLEPLEQEVVSLVVPGVRTLRKPPTGHKHKYDHGHALVLGGGVGRGGAGRLAARAALRVGAGAVTIGVPPVALIENAAQLDAIMLAPLADAEAMERELAARKVRAVCIGPGFGAGDRLRSFLEALLKGGVQPHHTDRRFAAVLDADALSEFRDDPETLFAMLHEDCILTPHQGEFGRLFPDIAEKLTEPAESGPAYSKVDATCEAAARAGCTVLLKGADTVIADPDGHCRISSAHYDRAAPWLATAGSGDVLAGFVTGLLARGRPPLDAASTAAWLHVECARKFGPGLVADDLPEQLPSVFRDLGL